MWYSEGEKTNPLDGTLLATTGKILTGNNTMATVIVAATVAAVVLLQHRDSGNAAALQSQAVRILANDTVVVPLGVQPLDLGEGIQVITSGATLGAVQASIIY